MVIINSNELKDKEVKIYPYHYILDGLDNDSQKIYEKFKIENAENNLIEYIKDTYLVLVVDDTDGDFVFGRFFKLRSDSPSIFNRKSHEEKPIELLADENIKEESHFIMNTKDSIIFAEYNFSAIRMFSSPMTTYLEEILKTKGSKVLPIEDLNNFENLKKEEDILSVFFRITQNSSKSLEETYNLFALKSLLNLSTDTDTIYEVSIKKARKKDSKLNKDEIIEMVGNLIDKKAPVEDIKLETADLVYDLTKGNFLFYRMDIETDGRNLKSSDFFNKAILLYKRQIVKIREMVRKED